MNRRSRVSAALLAAWSLGIPSADAATTASTLDSSSALNSSSAIASSSAAAPTEAALRYTPLRCVAYGYDVRAPDVEASVRDEVGSGGTTRVWVFDFAVLPPGAIDYAGTSWHTLADVTATLDLPPGHVGDPLTTSPGAAMTTEISGDSLVVALTPSVDLRRGLPKSRVEVRVSYVSTAPLPGTWTLAFVARGTVAATGAESSAPVRCSPRDAVVAGAATAPSAPALAALPAYTG